MLLATWKKARVVQGVLTSDSPLKAAGVASVKQLVAERRPPRDALVADEIGTTDPQLEPQITSLEKARLTKLS